MIEQVPIWFWYICVFILLSASGFGFTKVLQHILDRNKTDWTEMKESIAETTKNVNDLVSISKLHHYRLDEHSEDIKEIRRSLGIPMAKAN